jgi:Ca2+-binding EF-hand superfamily protein
MSSSKKSPEINDIVKGFKMFSSDNSGLINPNEFKEIMETLNMDEKNPFIYNIIIDLCSDPEIQQKGGIDAGDFISSLDQELNDTSSADGLQNIFSIFSNSTTNTIPLQNFTKIDEEDISINGELNKIKNLISKPEINGKELNFQEFNEIMKDETPKENEEQIYIKKNNSREEFINNLKSSNHDENNKFITNESDETGVHFNKKNIFNSINQKDSNYSSDKNSEKYSYENKRSPIINEDNIENNNYRYKKSRPQKSFPPNDNNNYDINNFDNNIKYYKKNIIGSDKDQEVTKTKKKYRHMLSSKKKEKNKEKMDNNNKRMIENDIKNEENSGEKSDKAERRYHRRYRETKSSNQDKKK